MPLNLSRGSSLIAQLFLLVFSCLFWEIRPEIGNAPASACLGTTVAARNSPRCSFAGVIEWGEDRLQPPKLCVSVLNSSGSSIGNEETPAEATDNAEHARLGVDREQSKEEAVEQGNQEGSDLLGLSPSLLSLSPTAVERTESPALPSSSVDCSFFPSAPEGPGFVAREQRGGGEGVAPELGDTEGVVVLLVLPVEGWESLFCASCLRGDINLERKCVVLCNRCEFLQGCSRKPIFGDSGAPPSHCALHKGEEQVYSTVLPPPGSHFKPTCQHIMRCDRVPSYGEAEELKARFCKGHKQAHHVDLRASKKVTASSSESSEDADLARTKSPNLSDAISSISGSDELFLQPGITKPKQRRTRGKQKATVEIIRPEFISMRDKRAAKSLTAEDER
ncbi:hypothetical protein GUITHDRAFT_114198 [Guillardia theta CCMP2712]|uniref:Uncharacterized protein n=1 Tax=Guillardia theta (strain CCMP2712) TaxID=905079 RepID=L1ITY2_GUITC|nr:hypothetical protein GUITHDRAFT_114198 [Guillardia theta CCMP2712]EKX39703.1 hypothetical protein GUITHDRAFT_114198 [Guillardia theta CCMP2712]|eukprot:XP_005826683.1 hypothetical protein GUITHDRAFT_114198 [Guillardia theta CCMP2712]